MPCGGQQEAINQSGDESVGARVAHGPISRRLGEVALRHHAQRAVRLPIDPPVIVRDVAFACGGRGVKGMDMEGVEDLEGVEGA